MLKIYEEERNVIVMNKVINNYDLGYDIFLAEQEMFQSLMEDCSLDDSVYLAESVQETISNYINKVVNSTQQVWNKFKIVVGNSNDIKFLNSINGFIQNSKPSFSINEYPIYSMANLSDIHLQIFNYETMKNNLKTESEFTKRYYPRFKSGNTTRQNVRSMVITKVLPTLPCTSSVIQAMYKFCTKDFYTYRDRILKRDIMDLNKSLLAIQGFVNTNTAVKIATESVMLFEDTLSEAIINGSNPNNKPKTSFSDTPSNIQKKGTSGVNSNDHNNVSTIRMIVNFVNVTTKVLSAKMKILAECYKLYFSTLKHFAQNSKGEKVAAVTTASERPIQNLKTQVKP
jgi:hypothetical protein